MKHNEPNLLNVFSRNHSRILAARPDRIGDVVLSTRVYHTLKKSFPNSFVGALVSSYTQPLLNGNPYIDAVIIDDPEKQNFRMKVKEIRKYRFDTALLLMPTKRLAYISFLSGIPYRVGVGHILYEVITFMHSVSRRKYIPLRHESDYMLDLAREIGAREVWTNPEIFLNEEEKEFAREFLERKGFNIDRSIVGIHPGSGHSSPNWEVERYAELASMLVQQGVQVLVTGSTKEKKLEEAFTQQFPFVPLLQMEIEKNLKTAFGELSLRELSAVLSQVNLLISSSTGPMHIAAAVGTPTVSMFCPLTACSPKLWGPIGNVSKVILPPDDFCQMKCPGDPHICTFGSRSEGITVRKVFETVIEYLNKMETAYDDSPSGGQ
jgi:heptosyltransferase-2